MSIITHHLGGPVPRIIYQRKGDRINEGKNNQMLSLLTHSMNIIGPGTLVSKTEEWRIQLQTPQMLPCDSMANMHNAILAPPYLHPPRVSSLLPFTLVSTAENLFLIFATGAQVTLCLYPGDQMD